MYALNHDNFGRFTILYDKVIPVDQAGAKLKEVKAYVPLNNHVRYSGTTAETEALGSVHMLYLSDDNTNKPNFQFHARLEFIDN